MCFLTKYKFPGQFYEGFNKEGKESMLPYGVYTIDDLKQYGADRNWCPYFLSRFAVSIFIYCTRIEKLQAQSKFNS